MSFPEAKNTIECARSDIAAYVDGELPPAEEIEMEKHFAVCKSCAAELNEQKNLLLALDRALAEKEFRLPENFTKIVVASAESGVSGLRRSNERSNALFICSALFLLIFTLLGGESINLLSSAAKLVEQFLAVGVFASHLAYDIAIGAIVILRSLLFLFVYNSNASLAAIAIVFGISVFVFSRNLGLLKIKR